MPGETIAAYSLRRFQTDRLNPQLSNLRSASLKAPTSCAKYQLYGEFLHAFEDSFGHRSVLNEPVSVNAGFGHFVYGHSPDRTYNHWGIDPGYAGAFGVYWGSNEGRTFEMEKQVYNKISSDLGGKGRVTSFESLAIFLQAFNREKDIPTKMFMLDEKLIELGYGPLPAYDKIQAGINRDKYLCSLQPRSNYPGVIFPKAICGTIK